MHKWRRFRRLAAQQKAALLWALVLIPATAAGLRLLGLRRWKAFLVSLMSREVSGASSSGPLEQIESARNTARMVRAAAREGVYPGRCLEQSLVLWTLLLRQGLPAELRIGVRQAPAGFEAHAWVELFGAVVNDSDAVRQEYVPFERDIASLGI